MRHFIGHFKAIFKISNKPYLVDDYPNSLNKT